MLSSGFASCDSAQAYLTLMSSAYCVGVRIEIAMSLVTWSPAIGNTAVWRMAPCENTARSVVPPPMSMMQTPRSFSSSVRHAKLEASCSSTMSSTSRPQRWMHFSMFCAALSAPVTMCTLASRRTPDMPMGSRMPSCPSMMNSCGSTCRIFWSAGIATALAASTTASTSAWLTSRSRIATTPCEFRLRTWLPAMPANTERISHPAMSSASSTARWIDCTVDSMLTTTPFSRPREGCVPIPITSIELSGATSPTSADTFEVPTSRPMIRFLSGLLAIYLGHLIVAIRVVVVRHAARNAGTALAPANGETVRVSHVDVPDVARVRGDLADTGRDEAREAFIDLPAAEPHGDAVVEIEFPGATRIEAHRRQTHAGFDDLGLRGEITAGHFAFGATRARQPRQFRRNVPGLGDEEFTARVQQAVRAPAR